MNAAWRWAVPTNLFKVDTHEQLLAICQEAGIAGVEGSAEWFAGTDEQIESVVPAYHDAGVTISSFHLPFGVEEDISIAYEHPRREAVRRLIPWIERAARLGARAAILHPNYHSTLITDEELEVALRQLGRSLEQLLPVAEAAGVTLALENVLPPRTGEGTRLGMEPEHFERIAAMIDHPNLGFCLDTGHALVAMKSTDGAEKVMRAMGERIVAFHLADTSGDRDLHLAPGRGNVAWEPVFQHAAAIGFKHPICIETPPFAPGPPFSLDAWREMIADARALAERAVTHATQ